MSLKTKYNPDHKQTVIAALQVMIDNLCTNLQIIDSVSSDLDTEEEHRRIFEPCDPPLSPEELRQSLEDSRDSSIRELGHIQKRIDEVRALKEAFDAEGFPSADVLGKTYTALRSSLIYAAMGLCFGNPREQIFTTGVIGLGKEKAEEVEQLGKTIQAYTEALMFGFNVSMFFWNEFPFDDA